MQNKTIKAYLWELLDDLPSGKYGLWYLTDSLNIITGHRSMPHTVRRYIREYCEYSGAEFVCIVQNDAIYQYTQGYKIAGALIGGKE